MKTLLRKTLSLFLAFAMLAAALPAITPTAEAAGEKLSFSFQNKNLREVKYENGYGYEYLDDTVTAENAGGDKYGTVYAKAGEYMAYKVTVPQIGMYTVEQYGHYWAGNATINYHFIPMSLYDAEADNLSTLVKSGEYIINTKNTSSHTSGNEYVNNDLIGTAAFPETEGIFVMESATAGNMRILFLYLTYASELVEKPVERTYSWKAASHGGHADTTDSFANGDYNSYNPDAGRYWAYISSYLGSGFLSQGNEHLLVYAKALGGNDYVAFKIDVPEAGEYDAKMVVNAVNSAYSGLMNLYIVPYSAEVAANPAAYMLGKYKAVSGINNYTDAVDAGKYKFIETPFNIEFKAGGDYVLIMQAERRSGGDWPYMMPVSLTITKTGEATAAETQDVTGEDVLGEYYACINGGVLNLYGGVKKLEGYSKVGFEIKTVGGEWTAISEGTSSVYSTLKGKDGRSVGVTAFGDACKYVFADSTAAAVAGEVSIRAYAVPVEGETVYGYEYTVNIE